MDTSDTKLALTEANLSTTTRRNKTRSNYRMAGQLDDRPAATGCLPNAHKLTRRKLWSTLRQGLLWPRASGSSQGILSLASTMPVSDQVPLTHTTASVEEPSKHHSMLSRLRGIPATQRSTEAIPPTNFKHYVNHIHISSKEGGKALGKFLAASQARMRPLMRENLPEDEEDSDHG